MGDVFSEADLLALAYDYEQATNHRRAPHLVNVADVNRDGVVDYADFLTLSQNFGQRRRLGDVNLDRAVDFTDFLILSKNFGYGTSDPVNVPESGRHLLVLALPLVAANRLRRGRRIKTRNGRPCGT